MQPYMFTTLVWDNIDHIEDTLSGRDNSHRGIGITIQPCFIGPELASPILTVPKTKRHTINFELEPLAYFIAGNKIGPPNTIAMEPQNAFALLDAERKTNSGLFVGSINLVFQVGQV